MNLDRVIAVRNNKIVYRDGDQCIQVFNVGFSKADVLNEALNQARIEETGLKIPKVIEVTMHEGRWVIVSEYIEGKTLDRLMKENPEKKDEYVDLLVRLQMEVHAKTCPLLNRLRDKMSRWIAITELDATLRYDLHTRLEAMPRHNKICHGDFNPSNVVITQDGTPYILDWSHASQGNAAADIARSYLWFYLKNGAEDAEYYLNAFCEKSGAERHYVQKWLPMVAAAQMAKGNADERAALEPWTRMVDYH